MALEIAKLVGNVLLALQVVGSLLKDKHPSIIAGHLRRDLIPALSPELLPSTERVPVHKPQHLIPLPQS